MAFWIYARMREGLPHEHRFVNRVDVGGRTGGGRRAYARDSWVTVVFSTPRGRLPQTGLQDTLPIAPSVQNTLNVDNTLALVNRKKGNVVLDDKQAVPK